MMNTIRGAVAVSLRVAHVTRDTSCRTWLTNCAGLTFAIVIPVPTPERGRRPPVSRQRPRAHPIDWQERSEEHTSELQSLMRISYAVFCLKKKKYKKKNSHHNMRRSI